jgi:hypothetical protein
VEPAASSRRPLGPLGPRHRPLEPLCCLLAPTGVRLLQELAVDIDPEQVIVLIELFGRHLLLKQQDSPLLLVDIVTGEARLVPGFRAPLAFIYTDANAQFLCFHDRRVRACVRACHTSERAA